MMSLLEINVARDSIIQMKTVLGGWENTIVSYKEGFTILYSV